MAQPAADRNMLFGVLAMQMDFITRDQLVTAMQTWVFDKSKTLGDILVAQKVLPAENRALLDSVVQQHLAKHNDDMEKSLAAISPPADLHGELSQITDMDVQKSLGHMQVRPLDPYATIAPTPSMIAAVGGTAKGTGLRFRIVRPHARGGLGEVFVALDEELNREVALKEIQDHQADNQESRNRFLLEAEITGGLEHPGIVPIYGLGAYEDGRPYYAMRFIRGDNLKDAIDRHHKAVKAGMSPGDQAVEMRGLIGRFVDVCNAMAYAHSRGILHRDLKPGNIMLGKYGETLVVDWGLAKPLDDQPEEGKTQTHEPGEGSLRPSSITSASQTLVGSAVGTPQYMSPEQAAGRLDQLSPASDVYSLGATLYCILTGKTPISDSDIGTTLQRVQRGDFPPPREVQGGVAPALNAICLKAMELKSADRYQNARLLAEDIEHWLADEPVSAWTEPWTVTTRRWIGRHATLVTSVASAVVVGLVGLIMATILLTAAKERETQAKEKAEENFRLAKQAVDTYHTKVSEDDLLQEPGMEPLRKKLLQEAERYYDKFVKDRAGDPALQGELGNAKFRLAQITGDIGSRSDAIKLDEQAVHLFETLPAANVKTDFQADQATAYHHLGRLYRLTNQLAKSDEAYAKSLKVWETLVASNPHEPRIQAGFARIQMQLGNQNQVAGHLGKAQASYEKSLHAWNELVKTKKDVPEYQREIGVNYANLALIYQRRADKERDAEKALRSAYTIQKKLADDAPNISKYQDDFARTCYSLARTVTSTGDATGEAARLYREAAERWQALVATHPTVTDYHLRLAEDYMNLAHVQLGANDLEDAGATARKALAIQRKLVEKNKDDDNFQGVLATGLYNLASLYNAGERSAEADAKFAAALGIRAKDAESAYVDAIAIQEKLAAKPSAPHHHLRDLAKSYNGLGLFQMRQGRDEKASQAFRDAAVLWQKLVKANPDDQEYTIGLSEAYYYLGNVAKFAGKPMEAEPRFTKAIEAVDVKNTLFLANVNVRTTLSNAYWSRAEMRTMLGRHDVALTDWDHALEFAGENKKPSIRLPRAAALARAGRFSEAAEEADQLVGLALAAKDKNGNGTPAGIIFRFARVYALCASAAVNRKDLADKYAGKAIELLGVARERNFFNSLNERTKLQKDPALDVLRDRPEFKKLTSGLDLQ